MADSLLSEAKKFRRKAIATQAAQSLSLVGLLIVISAINIFVFSILPLRVLQADWQLVATGALLSVSTNLLIGTLFVFLAGLVSSESEIVRKNSVVVAALARGMPILMILLIPLSFLAGYGAINNQARESRVELRKWNDQLTAVIALGSEAEMRQWAATLPNAPEIPQPLVIPFAEMKQRMVDNLTGKVNSIKTQIEANTRSAWGRFLTEFLRNSIQALITAFGFKVIAVTDMEVRRL